MEEGHVNVEVLLDVVHDVSKDGRVGERDEWVWWLHGGHCGRHVANGSTAM